MPKQPTAIRRMWYHYSAASITSNSAAQLRDIGGKLIREAPRPVLVIPDNPAAREAMIQLVLKTAGVFKSRHCRISRPTIEYVLATALTPARTRKPRPSI